jgi:hypothetical protein
MNRIAYIIPTHDRPEVLGRTLRALGALPRHDAELVLVDNASRVHVGDQVRDGLGGVVRTSARRGGTSPSRPPILPAAGW